jgi:hypothetical protein
MPFKKYVLEQELKRDLHIGNVVIGWNKNKTDKAFKERILKRTSKSLEEFYSVVQKGFNQITKEKKELSLEGDNCLYFMKSQFVLILDYKNAFIKTIRDARFATAQPAPVYASAQAAWKGILDERRLELSFEGFRFIDLKRIGTLAGAGLDRDASEYASSSWTFPAANPSNLPLTSTKFALPVPQVEIVGNPAIQQNPGY